ncbi:ThiF family adenylyltransferase [Metabacillus sp. GX 13764]|uniref:ThiF family adenylyltransferase n=1 Tax=Metabacillus kandeliae TaxID=2900151 RepID=UPI001E4AFCBF|nr:ThiF family adenylyltransferase [Metabacillus kandeliae]MCD7035219.1 ThiF family adenylyltransferase [Metabacillus kandeliae]
MENNRYSRQILFSPIGEEGQKKIRQKKVVLIGAGALGSGTAEALVRAGIGSLVIIDRDYVDESNLQRQQLYTEQDAGEQLPKAEAAKRRLEKINSDVSIIGYIADADPLFLEPHLKDTNLIMDGTDNFETRYMINDLAVKHGIPWIYGACVSSYGITYTILPGETPCLTCLMKKMPLGGATCDTAGIISPAVSMVTAHQTADALKILTDQKDKLKKELLSFDIWEGQYTSIKVSKMKKDSCPTCGTERVYPYLQAENTSRTAVLCGRDTVQIRPPEHNLLNVGEKAEQLQGKVEGLFHNPFLLSFQAGELRLVAFKDGRVLVHGTKKTAEAKSVYHRYFG